MVVDKKKIGKNTFKQDIKGTDLNLKMETSHLYIFYDYLAYVNNHIYNAFFNKVTC